MMYKIAGWLSAALFAFVLSSVAQADVFEVVDSEWYSGGSLHGSSVDAWHAASHRNRLATAADWVVAYVGTDVAAPLLHNGLKELSEAVVTCVDQGTEDVPEVQNHKVLETAVMCMILMKYPAKPQ